MSGAMSSVPPTARSGAWEVVVDTATLEVAKYLSATTKPFNPETPVANFMLILLDRSSLRDVLVERNYNRLCGCIGCPQLPRGLSGAGDHTPSFEWVTADGASDTEDGEGGRDDDERAEAYAAMVRGDAEGGPSAEAREEVVYEDDVYTAESFRLARRQLGQLQRLRRKVREAKHVPAVVTSSEGQSTGPHTVLGNSANSAMLGATMADRFCSVQCFDYYENELRSRVARLFAYDHPMLMQAIAGVFPNMRLDVLQRLASAEPTGKIVGNVSERAASTAPLPPVQIGVSYEVAPAAAGGGGGTEANDGADVAELRARLEEAHILQRVWDSEVVPRFHPSAAAAAGLESQPHRDGGAAAHPGRLVGASAPEGLRGALLVMDFLLHICGPRTARLTQLHYAAHRASAQAAVARWGAGRPTALYAIMAPVIAELEARAATVAEVAATHAGAVEWLESDGGSPSLAVHPSQQQQRRQLVADSIFSEEALSTLSRLLMMDYDVLSAVGWRSVWQTPPPILMAPSDSRGSVQVAGATTLLLSLQFPFAVPGRFVLPAHSCPEVLQLALTLLLVAGCVNGQMLRGLLEAEEEVEELLEAIGLGSEEVLAAVKVVVFNEEH